MKWDILAIKKKAIPLIRFFLQGRILKNFQYFNSFKINFYLIFVYCEIFKFLYFYFFLKNNLIIFWAY